MRLKVQQQLPIVFREVRHRWAEEFEAIDAFLAGLDPAVLDSVHADLVRGLDDPGTGRPGLSADVALRALITKVRFRLSYERLEFLLRDSSVARRFCRIEDDGPSRSALHRAIKSIRPETLEVINGHLVRTTISTGLEDGRIAVLDATVVEAHICAPTDSGLLVNVIRTGTRLLCAARGKGAEVDFVSHNRLARRRHLAIQHCRRKAARVPHYRVMLWAAGRTLRWCAAAADLLPERSPLHAELRTIVDVGRRVISQARRRILRGESVPAGDKVLSIAEPHVDIIIKDWRETYFGHKLFAAMAPSGLMLDITVPRGNPNDAASTVGLVDRVKDVTGQIPDEVAMDGGFASKANLTTLKERGVGKVCFAKRGGMTIEDMVGDKRSFRRLRNLRSRIEAAFSWLKRAYGLGRCDWSGYASFRAYAWASVLTYNLVLAARAGPCAA